MSMFEDGRYRWRETYFVQFDAKNRPMLAEVEKRLLQVADQFGLTSPRADKQGRFESLTVLAPEDFSALDISYIEGEEVLEQGKRFAEELTASGCMEADDARIERLRGCAGRFDVLHFEQVGAEFDRDEAEEMFDPSCLLLVLDVLAELTDGIAFDPQGGTIM